MRYLYKGKNKIGKIHMKTKVDTSFITAGPEDITAGKKTINGNYEEITGTMDVNELLTELTSDADATAADITAGKTGYAKGKKLVGTSPRSVSGLLMTNGVIDSYEVGPGETINSGDFVTVDQITDGYVSHTSGNTFDTKFSEGRSRYTNIVKINDTKALLIYSDDNYNKNGIIKIANVDGITTTFSNRFIFNSEETQYIHAIKISDRRVLISYSGTNGGFCKIVTLNESYTSLTVSDAYLFDNNIPTKIKLIKLNDNKCVISYTTSYNIILKTININYNDSLSYGVDNTIYTTNTVDEIAIGFISSSKILLVHNDGDSAYIRDLSINVDRFSSGTAQSFNSNANYINLVKMSNTKFLLLYTDQTAGGTYAQLVFYNKNSIKLLNPVKINDGYFNSMVATFVKTNRVCIMFNNRSDSNRLSQMYILTDPDNRITPSVISRSPSNDAQDLAIELMYEDVVITAFNSDPTNPSSYGSTRLLKVGGQITSSFVPGYLRYKFVVLRSTGSGAYFNAIANTSGVEGDIIEVITPPKS